MQTRTQFSSSGFKHNINNTLASEKLVAESKRQQPSIYNDGATAR
jgi:hypothetical protein